MQNVHFRLLRLAASCNGDSLTGKKKNGTDDFYNVEESVVKKVVILILFICTIILYPISFTYAAVAPQYPWEKTFDDSNIIFYMTPQWLTPGQQVDEDRMKIKSGLYYNETPLINIYYFDGYFHEGTSSFSDDGICFAQIKGTTSGSFDNLTGFAVIFYKNGSLVKSYQVGDLLRDKSKASFHSEGVSWFEKREFNRKTNALTVVTLDERVYVFDIVTGDIISEPPEDNIGVLRRIPVLSISLCSIALLATVVALMYKKGILKLKAPR